MEARMSPNLSQLANLDKPMTTPAAFRPLSGRSLGLASDRVIYRAMMPAEGKSSFLVGLFLICMCALMLQIIETRILSVVAYYYLAFFAIGMAMFGMTAGSPIVYFREQLFPGARLMQNLVWISSAFAIAVVVSALLAITTVLTGVSKNLQFFTTPLPMGQISGYPGDPVFLRGHGNLAGINAQSVARVARLRRRSGRGGDRVSRCFGRPAAHRFRVRLVPKAETEIIMLSYAWSLFDAMI
jgi:hypothetical protein